MNVTAPIVVQSLDTREALALVDVSLGGFSLRSAGPLPIGAVMRFRFSTAQDQWASRLTARSLYCRLVTAASPGPPFYITGFTFLDADAPSVMAAIHALVDRATAAISFS